MTATNSCIGWVRQQFHGGGSTKNDREGANDGRKEMGVGVGESLAASDMKVTNRSMIWSRQTEGQEILQTSIEDETPESWEGCPNGEEGRGDEMRLLILQL